jgi:small subunit ribosomal protein S24e
MEIQIIKDKTNSLLNRREISLRVKDKSTPSRIEVKGKLAALLNSKPELIVIERLDTIYGKQELMGTACIYHAEERLKQLAHQHLIARDAPKAKEGAEAVPAQAAPPVAEKVKEPEAKPEVKSEAKPKHEAKPKSEAKAEEKKKSEEK